MNFFSFVFFSLLLGSYFLEMYCKAPSIGSTEKLNCYGCGVVIGGEEMVPVVVGGREI
jgi:hypothetical protein